MTHIGVDLGRRTSHICILTHEGELLERGLRTERERFAAALRNHPGARVLLEAGTQSEWGSRCLEGLGHEVIFGDPNYAPMHARRQRKVKTNHRDARALAEACRLEACRPAHRTREAQRRVRARIAVREALVRTRSRYVDLIGSLLRQVGLSLPAGGTATFLVRLQAVTLPEPSQHAIAPMLPVLENLQAQIRQADRQLEALSCTDPRVRRLRSAPGIGLVTAATLVATVDRADQFAGPHHLEAYPGLKRFLGELWKIEGVREVRPLR